jgi:hypothetical protein
VNWNVRVRRAWQRAWWLSSLCVVATACSSYQLAAQWNELRGDAYPLDSMPRQLEPSQQASCPEGVETVVYGGAGVPYERAVRVARAFEGKLRRFEQAVVELARARYGRAPERLLHVGARACRPVRGNGTRLSEHALANALDVTGFRFGRATEQPALPDDLPDALRRSFTLTVRRHWTPGSDAAGAMHSRFLRDLIDRIQRDGLFRGIVGPGREGHSGHLHLDYAPWRYTLL